MFPFSGHHSLLGGGRGDGVGPLQEVPRLEEVRLAHRGSQRPLRTGQAVELEDAGAERGGGDDVAADPAAATTNAAAATENAFHE